MTSIGPFSPAGVGRPSLAQALAQSRGKLDELTAQLSTGKTSTSYSGLGDGAATSLAMRSRLAAIGSYQATAATVGARVNVLATTLTGLEAIGAQFRLTDPNAHQLTTGSVTVDQAQAATQLREAIAHLNVEIGGRFLFSGRASDVKPVISADAMLADDGAKAGLRTLVAERKLADLGADGRGRLDLSELSGASFTLSQEASGPFGFKLASLASTLTGGVAEGPAGAPASIGRSLTIRMSGSATAIISTPRSCSAVCQPKRLVSAWAMSGTSAPPTPIPR